MSSSGVQGIVFKQSWAGNPQMVKAIWERPQMEQFKLDLTFRALESTRDSFTRSLNHTSAVRRYMLSHKHKQFSMISEENEHQGRAWPSAGRGGSAPWPNTQRPTAASHMTIIRCDKSLPWIYYIFWTNTFNNFTLTHVCPRFLCSKR